MEKNSRITIETDVSSEKDFIVVSETNYENSVVTNNIVKLVVKFPNVLSKLSLDTYLQININSSMIDTLIGELENAKSNLKGHDNGTTQK